MEKDLSIRIGCMLPCQVQIEGEVRERVWVWLLGAHKPCSPRILSGVTQCNKLDKGKLLHTKDTYGSFFLFTIIIFLKHIYMEVKPILVDIKTHKRKTKMFSQLSIYLFFFFLSE